MRPLIVKVNDERYRTDEERGYVFLSTAEARYDPFRQMVEELSRVGAMGTPKATSTLSTHKGIWSDNDGDDTDM